MAAVCRNAMATYELGVIAALESSREAAYHALLLDPLSAAVCSPAEIRQMVDELIDSQSDLLPGFQQVAFSSRLAVPHAGRSAPNPAMAGSHHRAFQG